jgi:hypothetical protein
MQASAGQPLAAIMTTPLSTAIVMDDRNAHVPALRSILTLPRITVDYKVGSAKVNLTIGAPNSSEIYADAGNDLALASHLIVR